jgi:hypothetical protein
MRGDLAESSPVTFDHRSIIVGSLAVAVPAIIADAWPWVGAQLFLLIPERVVTALDPTDLGVGWSPSVAVFLSWVTEVSPLAAGALCVWSARRSWLVPLLLVSVASVAVVGWFNARAHVGPAHRANLAL